MSPIEVMILFDKNLVARSLELANTIIKTTPNIGIAVYKDGCRVSSSKMKKQVRIIPTLSYTFFYNNKILIRIENKR